MDIGSIFLILAILIPVVIYISRPLIESHSTKVNSSQRDISALLAKRDQLVANIQELDDDYKLGKIPTENYPSQRQSLLQNGADVLRQIDAYQAARIAVGVDGRMDMAIGTPQPTLYAEPSSKKNGTAVPPVPDDELEQRIASRRRSMQGKAGGFCPKCGRPVHEMDRFCPRCGAALT